MLLWLKVAAPIPYIKCLDQQRASSGKDCACWPNLPECHTRPPPTPSPFEKLLRRVKNLEAEAANNKQAIVYHSTRITSNSGKITSNTGKIDHNSEKIKSNTGKITGNTGKIDHNSEKTKSNSGKIN